MALWAGMNDYIGKAFKMVPNVCQGNWQVLTITPSTLTLEIWVIHLPSVSIASLVCKMGIIIMFILETHSKVK